MKFAVLIALVAAALAVGTVSTSRAAAFCGSYKSGKSSGKYETIGSWTCAAAKPWVLKLSNDHLGHITKNTPLKNGPSGLHCFADGTSKDGRATSGTCIAGTIQFPKKGFA